MTTERPFMQKLDKLLNGIENFFAGLRVSQLPADCVAYETFPDHINAAVVACRIAKNDKGGWSIFLGEGGKHKIGNYASYDRARHVAEDLNFFLVEDAK